MTRYAMGSDRRQGGLLLRCRIVGLVVVILGVTLFFSSGSALASKQIIDQFGSPANGGSLGGGEGTLGGELSLPEGVAVNNSGAGPADEGDIYVADGTGSINTSNPRLQRFGHNYNGTPTNPYDDTYPFLSAWGAGVETGGSNYEICTVAVNCRSGIRSGGNGTTAGNGAFAEPAGIAIDQDTGFVFVSDRGNHRVDVYDGTGVFLRAFGFDVVQSGPGDTGTGYEICVAASGDVCKAGRAGSGVGQLGVDGSPLGIALSQPDGSPSSGTVFVSDPGNQRVNTYNLDGSSPSSLGSSATFGADQPTAVAVDSRGIVYASNQKNSNEIERYDSENVNGGGVGFLAPIAAPPLLPSSNFNPVTTGLAIDPDSDGAGSDSDVLYVLRTAQNGAVQQFGPVNSPGLTAPPAGVDDEHGTLSQLGDRTKGIAIDEAGGTFLVTSPSSGGQNGHGVYVLGDPAPAPTANLGAVDEVTSTSANVHGSVDPNGGPDVSYRFEYSTDGSTWIQMPKVLLGRQETPQSVSMVIDPPPFGLEPSTLYHVRLAAEKVFQKPVVTGEGTFTTSTAPPSVETVGSPVRSATTAWLEARVNPRNAATSYRFEYGDQGPCDANPCTSTGSQPAGSGALIELVSASLEGLQPGTTYHYRVVGEGPAGTSEGQDMALRTFASDAPLTHGHLPGPPGSDRAWEQVNTPDTGGNPVTGVTAISDNGDRAIYQIAGGNPLSEAGTVFNQLFAERTPAGWQAKKIYPAREEAKGSLWLYPAGASDLSQLFAANFSNGAGADASETTTWRIGPNAQATKVFGVEQAQWGQFTAVSDDASRVLTTLSGPSHDPEFPLTSGSHIYDVTTGAPKLADLLPDGSVPPCSSLGFPSPFEITRASHWISADGSHVFFPNSGQACGSSTQLYVRDLEAGATTRVSPPSVSGASCDVEFIKSTPSGAFFWTQSRLVEEDTPAESCSGSRDGDVYRYEVDSNTLSCLTCAAEIDADVQTIDHAEQHIAVSEDGSHIYFTSPDSLVSGAEAPGIYRVNVGTGSLAYVAPGENSAVGDDGTQNEAVSADGSVLVFASASATLNPLNGLQNGGTKQYYRYDDDDRSLVCVSCPVDGSAPVGPVPDRLVGLQQLGPNLSPLDEAGDLAFSTPTALVSADQNTAKPAEDPVVGIDLYEWRDGRRLLVSDGLNSTPVLATTTYPKAGGMTPSGRDIFFTEATQLTADALDGYQRLYDARVGGGFNFPPPPKPCPLEVCQGIPKGAPDEPPPGTSAFAGPGNSVSRHHKKRRQAKHHHKKRQHRANRNRGSSR